MAKKSAKATKPATMDTGGTATLDPPCEPIANPVDSAVALRRQWAESERRELEEDHQRAFATIAEILKRSEDPQPDDAERLADAMEASGIDEPQIQSIANTLKRAARYTESHDDRDAANTAVVAARSEAKAMGLRHKEEIEVLRVKTGRATNRLRQASLAPAELQNLARQWPLLFDLDVDPPRLRS